MTSGNHNLDYARTDDPFMDAEALCQKHNLAGAPKLADILMWVDEKNYDPVARANGGGEMRRPYASELQANLRLMASGCNDARNFDLIGFDGIVSLACADLYGLPFGFEAMQAIGKQHLLPRRSAPLEPGPELAEMIVRPLATFWHFYRPSDQAPGFIDFAADALLDRWTFPEGVLPKAIEKTAKRWGFV